MQESSNIITKKILGQERARQVLEKELLDPQCCGSYLLEGMKSVGKFTTALQTVARLFCGNPLIGPCGDCSTCQRLSRRSHPDLLVLQPDPGKDEIIIEQVRDMLQQLQYPPLEAQKRVLLIDEADKLNAYAANALLKTLEEPAPHVIILLVSASPQQLLQTILSRVKRIRFAVLDDPTRAEILGLSLAQAKLLPYLQLQDLENQNDLQKRLESLSGDQESLIPLMKQCYQQQAGKSAIAPTGLWALGEFLLEDEDAIVDRCQLLLSVWRDVYLVKNQIDGNMLTHYKYNDDLRTLASHLSLQAIEALQGQGQQVVRAMQHQHANRKIAIEAILSQMEAQL